MIAAPSATARRWLTATTTCTVAAVVADALLAPRGGAPEGALLVAAIFVGPAMHVGATCWLATRREVRRCAVTHPVRLVLAPIACLALAPLVVTHLSERALVVGLEGFFAWQLLHFAKQHVGVASLASLSHGAGPLRPPERHAIVGAGACGVVALLARPSLLGLAPEPALAPLLVVGAVGLVAAGAVAARAVLRRAPDERPAGVVAAIAVAVAFPLPLFVVAAPYGALAGMTIAHGLQYLGLLGLAAIGPRARRRWKGLVPLLCVAFLGGLLVQSTTRQSLTAPSGRLALGLYLGLVTAHFVVDAGVWRLREPHARAFVEGALPDLVRPSAAAAVSSAADI